MYGVAADAPKQPKITAFTNTEEELQIKADVEIINFIARRNESFSVVEDPFAHSLLVLKYGANFVKRDDYYRTTGLKNATDYWNQKVIDLIKDEKLAFTTDLWTNLSSNFALIVITATYIQKWKRHNIILACRSIDKPHTAAKIQAVIEETLYELNIDVKNVIFITRDDGSDVKKACGDLAITSAQCGPHAFNNTVQSAFNGDVEKEELPKLKKKAQRLASSFCKKAGRRNV
uniref:Uncharacterized protein n=1 Tax=Panagrolaimus davidi TaxID=227884 RepID=A0A914QXV1_9BILA